MPLSKINFLSVLTGIGLVISAAPAHAAADVSSLLHAVIRGKELFMTATFNGNGRHCNTCHKGGGLDMGELPNGTTIPSLSNAAAIFPRYDEKRHQVKTLADQIHQCIKNAMEGHPPAYDSAEMTELVSYLTSLSHGIHINMGGKPQ